MINEEQCQDWSLLSKELRPFVARRVRPDEVEDVLQEVLFRLHKNVGSLRARERMGPWVYQVARNAVHDQLRSRRRREHRNELVDQEPNEATEPTEDETEAFQEELSKFVALLVLWLPSPYREAVTLTELEGLSQREAAEQLGVPLPTLKSRVQRGRAQLRESLERVCELALDARGRVVGCTPRKNASLPTGCCGPEKTC